MEHRILVTGCAGYVGRTFARVVRAVRPDAHLIGVAHSGDASAPGFDETTSADLRDPAAVERLLGATRPRAIVHLAGRREGTLEALLAANALATDHLLAATRDRLGTAVPVVVAGSSAELGFSGSDAPLAEDAVCRPIDDYGVAKLAQSGVASAAFLRHGQHVVRVRLFNLIGPGLPEHLLPGRCARLLAAMRPGGPARLSFRDLGTARDYVDTRDACRALLLALERAPSGELLHVGSGIAVSGREVVERLIAVARDRTGEVAYDESVTAPRTVPVQRADPTLAARVLGWRPEIPLERSIVDLWESVSSPAARATTPDP